MLKKIFEILPQPLKGPVKKIYSRFSSSVLLDSKMVKILSEYFNIPEKEILWLLKSGGRLNSDLWLIENPKTEKEKMDFYMLTPFYIFDLAFWHMTRAQRIFRAKIINVAKGQVLDFGGGIGDFCVKIAKKGFSVDYSDVYGKTFNFAKWLFDREKINVNMIDLTKEKFTKKYDTIFALDVIEHVPNPKEVVENLCSLLNSKGALVITGLNINEESQIHPMHQKINFDINYLQNLGIIESKEPWLFYKK